MANEKRMIDANALQNKIKNSTADSATKLLSLVFINTAPTVDAVEVVHGRWIFDFSLDGSNFYKCSVCGRQEVLLAKESTAEYFQYCHCGAKMDGGNENVNLR